MFRSVPEQLSDARANERVLPLQIEHQNQIWKAFQQVLAEFFLTMQPVLQGALLGHVHQGALVADQTPRLHHAA